MKKNTKQQPTLPLSSSTVRVLTPREVDPVAGGRLPKSCVATSDLKCPD